MAGKLGSKGAIGAGAVERPDVREVRVIRVIDEVPKDGLGITERTISGKRFVEHSGCSHRAGSPVGVDFGRGSSRKSANNLLKFVDEHAAEQSLSLAVSRLTDGEGSPDRFRSLSGGLGWVP